MIMEQRAFIRVLALAALLFGVIRCSRAQAQGAQQPETILYNGKIVTVDSKFSYGEAIAIGGGKVLAVGKNDDIRKMAGADTKQLDLHGKTVIPGLSDNHLHDV